jgi:hypothetical protein
MSAEAFKEQLRGYLQVAREAIVWKLDGLGEYDARRPMVATGTNLLGLVKHLANVEAGYFGVTFGRPYEGPVIEWSEDLDPTIDMWASAEESRDDVVGFYRDVWAHADATIEALPLDAVGQVPWWPAERAEVDLHRILVHVTTETHRHAGHADIVRELIDGRAGLRDGNTNLPDRAAAEWAAHRDRVEQAARRAGG